MRRRWIRFVWSLFPSDYRRDVNLSLLRAQASWADDRGKPRDVATIKQIETIRKDIR